MSPVSSSIAAFKSTAPQRDVGKMTRYSIIVRTLTSLSVLTQAASLGLIITLCLTDLQDNLQTVAIIAAVFQGIVLLALLFRVSQDGERRHRLQNVFLLSLIILSLTALALSIYVLSSAWLAFGYKIASMNKSITARIIISGMAVTACSLMLQASLLIIVITHKPPFSTPATATTTSVLSTKRYSLNRLGVAPSTIPYSPMMSSHSVVSSRHNSATHASAPLSSKTRLIISNPINAYDSQSQISRREPSLEIACRGDALDAGPHELSSSPISNKRTSPRRLDTIPGSRPATPLQPFTTSISSPSSCRDVRPEDFPLPDSPTLSRATSPVLASPTDIAALPFPPMIGEIATQTLIHPLFRPESPGPHPSTSPRTQIIASPFAGQMMNVSQVSLPARIDSRSPTLKMSTSTPDIPNFSRPATISRNELHRQNMI